MSRKTHQLALPATLLVVTAVLAAGCAPPPSPRLAYDSDITAIEPDGVTPDKPDEATPVAEPAAEPVMAPDMEPDTQPAAALEVQTPPEMPVAPVRELKPEDEPAPADDEEMDVDLEDEEEVKMDSELADPPSSEQPAPPQSSPESAKAAATPAGDRVVTGDWPCWGGDIHRNNVSAATGLRIDFEPAPSVEEGKNLLWVANLGSQTYGNPIVSGGKVFIGTNNAAGYRPQHKGDRGCLLCFDEKTGKFLWQLTRDKLPQGRENDWPEQGIASAPFVEGNRLWVVTNRCELICLDTEGFYDKKNDGPYTDEADTELRDADIIWVLDMIEELGVFPHNLANSSPIVVGDLVYVLTSNGVDETHLNIPAPEAPSFIAVHKETGEVVWKDNTPSDRILHGQWSSPAAGIVNGQTQIYMPGGDGWLYAMDAKTGEHLWKFDLNPKDSEYQLGGRGNRNSIIATPVFLDNSVVLAVGDDPEYGEGVGHIYRIDATKRGDVSPVTPDNEPNPNSAQIWHWGGVDKDGSLTGEEGNDCFRRTLSSVAIHDGLVYAPDQSGRIHCLDFETGQRYWEADILAAVWGSPLVADGKLFLGDEDGILSIFATGKEERKIAEIEFPSSIYSTPTIANGVMFISDRSRLYAFATQ